ncbi:hypothetical protein ACGFYV_07435 [Streptomyces sp. NPDC048297]|uniref:hypothetical protein n=1 Tax=Streptomyces sp. NPDC048297 TaxID=3365531 RepID=UPI003720B9FE
MHSKRMTMATTALVGALLAGCGSGGGDGGGSGSGGSGHQGSGTGASAVKLAVPAAYDGAKGWDQEIDWVPEDAATAPVATDGETVASIVRSGSGYAVQARDGATGKVRWTSASYRTPAVEDPEARWAMNTPGLTAVRQGGRTYFAAWAVGAPDDALSTTKEVTQVTIYPADASGSSVKPLHQLSVPDDHLRSGYVDVRDSGNGLLVRWESAGEQSVAVDAATGSVTRYDGDTPPLPGCADCTVDAVTPKGPVVSGKPDGPSVPGGWTGKGVAPKGVAGDAGGTVEGVRGGVLVADWQQADDTDDSKPRIWSAHDLNSGRLLASTTCDSDPNDHTHRAVASPNGTYLAYGPIVFDVKKGTAQCLAGDDSRRAVEILALADDGTAYGTTDDDSAGKPVIEVPAGSNTPKALTAGTLAPLATLTGAAVFTQRENGRGLRLSVRMKR